MILLRGKRLHFRGLEDGGVAKRRVGRLYDPVGALRKKTAIRKGKQRKPVPRHQRQTLKKLIIRDGKKDLGSKGILSTVRQSVSHEWSSPGGDSFHAGADLGEGKEKGVQGGEVFLPRREKSNDPGEGKRYFDSGKKRKRQSVMEDLSKSGKLEAVTSEETRKV